MQSRAKSSKWVGDLVNSMKTNIEAAYDVS